MRVWIGVALLLMGVGPFQCCYQDTNDPPPRSSFGERIQQFPQRHFGEGPYTIWNTDWDRYRYINPFLHPAYPRRRDRHGKENRP